MIASFMRFLWLDRIPTGIADDELYYVLTAKSLYYSGKDLTETIPLLTIVYTPSNFFLPVAKIPYIIFSPILGNLSLSLFHARLPYAFVSVLFCLVLYCVGYKLFHNKSYGLILGIIIALNPWAIYFGRTSFEAPLAIFFIFSALLILMIAKKWWLLLSFPLFLFGLFSYMGTSIIIPVFLIIATAYSYVFINKKKYILQYSILVTGVILATIGFIYLLKFQYVGSRVSELLTPNHSMIAGQVGLERQLSVPTVLTNIYTNKYIVFTKIILERYLNVFSPVILFMTGEGRATFTLRFHGWFYSFEIVLLLLGLLGLYKNCRKQFLFLILFVLIAPIPSVLSTDGMTFALRSSLLYPVLLFIIAYGVYYMIDSSKKYKIFVASITAILYVIFTVNFLTIYFFRNPIANSEAFGFSGRILSEYLQRIQKKGIVTYVMHYQPNINLFNQYLFYTDKYTIKTHKELSTQYRNVNGYSVDSIHFTSCLRNQLSQNTVIIASADFTCHGLKNTEAHTIVQLADSGSIYNIFNDQLCSAYTLSRYVKDITFLDLEINKLSDEQFCRKYIININTKE